MRVSPEMAANRSSTAVGAHLVVGSILLLMPVVSLQGPAHTTLMDAVSVVFLAWFWCHVLLRREQVSVPLWVPFWLILLGSCFGLYAAPEPKRALLEITKELYAYLWFISLAHFIARRCRIPTVTATWVIISSIIALLMSLDYHTQAFGGFFSDKHRAAGTFENPNMGGSYLVMAFFLAWALVGSGRRAFCLAMPLALAGCLATASNGTAMSLAVGSVATGACYAARRFKQFVGVGCLAAALAAVCMGFNYEQLVRSSMDQLSQGKRDQIGGTAMEGASERLPLWLDAAESLRRAPMGVGPANFNRQGGSVSGDFHAAHNTYVGMVVERGLLGLAGWCAILVGVGAVLGRLRRAARRGVCLLAVEPLYGALGAIIAHSLTMEMFHFRHLWMFMAIVFAAATQLQGWSVERSPLLGGAVRPAMAEGV